MSDRQATFDRLIEEYDPKQLPRVLDFAEHRFVTVERDSVSGATFVRGHKTMRGACGCLSRSVAGAERFIPQKVVDLDTEEVHELDVFAFVAPKSVDAVAVMMPRAVLESVDQQLEAAHPSDEEVTQARRLIKRALERSS